MWKSNATDPLFSIRVSLAVHGMHVVEEGAFLVLISGERTEEIRDQHQGAVGRVAVEDMCLVRAGGLGQFPDRNSAQQEESVGFHVRAEVEDGFAHSFGEIQEKSRKNDGNRVGQVGGERGQLAQLLRLRLT